MLHFCGRVAYRLFFLQLILDVVEELKIIKHSEELILVQGFKIDVVFLDVVENLGMYFWLLEVAKHLLSDAHLIIINGLQKHLHQEGRRGRVMLPSAYLHRKTHWLWHLLCSWYPDYNQGFVLEILSFGAILSIATGNPAKFAIIYSLGNILTLAAYTCLELELAS